MRQSARSLWSILFVCLSAACSSGPGTPEDMNTGAVHDSARVLMSAIARDVSAQGASAWIKYFDDSTDFFMASDGALAFSDYPTASQFIRDTLINSIPSIQLVWKNIRINPLSPQLAAIGAGFGEDLQNPRGETTHMDGYFTAVARWRAGKWKLQHAHWSVSR